MSINEPRDESAAQYSVSNEQASIMLAIASTYQRYMGQPLADFAEHDPEAFLIMCKEVVFHADQEAE